MREPLPADPPQTADERQTLTSFLDFYRSVMVRKVEGLDHDGLRMSPVDSGTSLGGLIKHLADVERTWFQERWADRPVEALWGDDWEDNFRVENEDSADSLIEVYRQECDASREIVATSALDDIVERHHGRVISLRWVLVHMIEETARHAGHADLIREMVDGSVGD